LIAAPHRWLREKRSTARGRIPRPATGACRGSMAHQPIPSSPSYAKELDEDLVPERGLKGKNESGSGVQRSRLCRPPKNAYMVFMASRCN
jgi:hypothetical protein